MNIYLLVREDQNQHGFVDAAVIGAFRRKDEAEARLQRETQIELENGASVEGAEGCPLDEWDVSLRVEEHSLI